MAPPIPRRGEVWIVDMGWQGKVRPALVVSMPASEDDRDLVTVISRTTSLRGSKYEVNIDASFFQRSGAFDVQTVVTVSRVKLQQRIGTLSDPQMKLVETALAEWLGMNASYT